MTKLVVVPKFIPMTWVLFQPYKINYSVYGRLADNNITCKSIPVVEWQNVEFVGFQIACNLTFTRPKQHKKLAL